VGTAAGSRGEDDAPAALLAFGAASLVASRVAGPFGKNAVGGREGRRRSRGRGGGTGDVGELDGGHVHGLDHGFVEHVFVVLGELDAFVVLDGDEEFAGVLAVGSAVVNVGDELLVLVVHLAENVVTNVHILAGDGEDEGEGVNPGVLGEGGGAEVSVLMGGEFVLEDGKLLHVPVEDDNVAGFGFATSVGGDALAEAGLLVVHESHDAVKRSLKVVEGLKAGSTTDFHDGAFGARALGAGDLVDVGRGHGGENGRGGDLFGDDEDLADSGGSGRGRDVGLEGRTEGRFLDLVDNSDGFVEGVGEDTEGDLSGLGRVVGSGVVLVGGEVGGVVVGAGERGDLHVEDVLGSNTNKAGEFNKELGAGLVVEFGRSDALDVDGDLDLGALPSLGGGKGGLLGRGSDSDRVGGSFVLLGPRVRAEAVVTGVVVGRRAGRLDLADLVAVLESGGRVGDGSAVAVALSGFALPVLYASSAYVLGEGTVKGMFLDVEVIESRVTLAVGLALGDGGRRVPELSGQGPDEDLGDASGGGSRELAVESSNDGGGLKFVNQGVTGGHGVTELVDSEGNNHTGFLAGFLAGGTFGNDGAVVVDLGSSNVNGELAGLSDAVREDVGSRYTEGGGERVLELSKVGRVHTAALNVGAAVDVEHVSVHAFAFEGDVAVLALAIGDVVDVGTSGLHGVGRADEAGGLRSAAHGGERCSLETSFTLAVLHGSHRLHEGLGIGRALGGRSQREKGKG